MMESEIQRHITSYYRCCFGPFNSSDLSLLSGDTDWKPGSGFDLFNMLLATSGRRYRIANLTLSTGAHAMLRVP